MASEAGILFVGTGVSAALPQLSHIIAKDGKEQCSTCLTAWKNPDGPNRRNNVSILIRFQGQCKPYNLLVDCGKTFRDAALRTLIPNNISKVDAVFLTHEHQDAIGGIDDLRDLQEFSRPPGPNGIRMFQAEKKLPIFLSRTTYEVLSSRYSYIVQHSQREGPQATKVAMVDFKILDTPDEDPLPEFDLDGAVLKALPVIHGDCTCLGLSFGSVDSRVIYLSDISAVPEHVEAYVRSLRAIKVLIIDCCYFSRPHASHISLTEALEIIERWQPESAYIVGMACDIEHVAGNVFLAKWLSEKKASKPNLRTNTVALSHDGLFIPLPL